MGFVERIFHPVISAVERAFTPPGTGGQEAAAQQQAAAAKPAALPPTLVPPTAPEAPKAQALNLPGQTPGGATRPQITASTMLGAAAAGQEVAKASAGGGSSKKTMLG